MRVTTPGSYLRATKAHSISHTPVATTLSPPTLSSTSTTTRLPSKLKRGSPESGADPLGNMGVTTAAVLFLKHSSCSFIHVHSSLKFYFLAFLLFAVAAKASAIKSRSLCFLRFRLAVITPCLSVSTAGLLDACKCHKEKAD